MKTNTFISKNFYVVQLVNTDPDEIDLPTIAVDFAAHSQGDAKTVKWLVSEENVPLIQKTYKQAVTIDGVTFNKEKPVYFGESTILTHCNDPKHKFYENWLATTF